MKKEEPEDLDGNTIKYHCEKFDKECVNPEQLDTNILCCCNSLHLKIVNSKSKETSTNSEIGSYHWFHTLMSYNKDIGEFLSKKTPDEELLRVWGKQLFKNCEELIRGFKDINQ